MFSRKPNWLLVTKIKNAQARAGSRDILRYIYFMPPLSAKTQYIAPWRLTVLTNPGLCNQHCPMCRVHSRYADPANIPSATLPFPVLEAVVRTLAPLGLCELIPSTMGEPFLYSDFAKMLALCTDTGVHLNITTNGSFPGGLDYWAPLLAPITTDIKFSLQNLSQLDTMRNIEQWQAWRASHAAQVLPGSTTSLQVILLHSCLTDIPELVQWAITHNITRIKFHHLQVHFPEMAAESLDTPTGQTLWNECYQGLPTEGIRLEGTAIPREAQHMADHKCLFLKKELWPPIW